ncbi:hypothetical protein FRC12_021489, partial [Ceratobasidium sp. 428]
WSLPPVDQNVLVRSPIIHGTSPVRVHYKGCISSLLDKPVHTLEMHNPFGRDEVV